MPIVTRRALKSPSAAMHHKCVGDFASLAREPLIVLETEQHVCGLAAVCDYHGRELCRFLYPQGISTKFAAGKLGGAHGRLSIQ
jgi:hypothetical protein